MSNNPEFHQCGTCGYEWKHGVHGGHSCTDTLSARLASQQAAHDAEIARLKEEYDECRADHQKITLDLLDRLSAANAACAMKNEALSLAQIGSCTCLTKTNEPELHAELCLYRVLDEAVSASQQQVSEWEAKKLEPLRAQVAMLKSAAGKYRGMQKRRVPDLELLCDYADELDMAVSSTQATADQFIAECKQRGAADMCDWLADNPPRTLGMWSHMELHDKADELRATSKKAG